MIPVSSLRRSFAPLTVFISLFASPLLSDELKDRINAVQNPRAENGWVTDAVGILGNRKADINALLTDLEREDGTEVALVILPTIGELIPKDFAVELFNKWGIGKKGKDNGILILQVMDQRRIEIETGYGMEGILPDVKCNWILTEVGVPYFKLSSYADGDYEVVRAVIRGIKNPQASHDEIVSNLKTKPGEAVDTVPSIPLRDEISLKYAPLPERVMHTPWYGILGGLAGIVLFLFSSLLARIVSLGRDPYTKFKIYKGTGLAQYLAGVLGSAGSLIFEYAKTETFWSPVPVLIGLSVGVGLLRGRRLKALRDEPRTCECGNQMRRLDEKADDEFLKRGNIVEEEIGSVEYDVWMCECGIHRIDKYAGATPASKCEKCGFLTFRVTGSRTIVAATTSSSGRGESTYTCANCKYSEVRQYTIPQISTSSSSGSSSSGRSSSGGSFGGGRSGGGGSGASW